MSRSGVEARRTRWRGREACVLANDQVELTHLSGGGQIVDLHFHDAAPMNPFWIPQWESRDPVCSWEPRDEAAYGPRVTGKLLSAIAGHSLCLGSFGMPSAEEAQAGVVLHGEAGIRRWEAAAAGNPEHAEWNFTVELPQSGLEFARTVSLRTGESVVCISERIRNRLDVDRFLQWQQHVALAPPFAETGACLLSLPGRRGITDSSGYEGHELLAAAAEFDWPVAPGADDAPIDLRMPLHKPGTGLVAGVQLNPGLAHGFVCASNLRHKLAFGYVFSRSRFPWVTLWEENRARSAMPWQAREQVCAMEFGVSPLPVGREEMLRRGQIFATPTMARVPAGGEIGATYVMFLARLPRDASFITEIALTQDELYLHDGAGGAVSMVRACGVGSFLREGSDLHRSAPS